MAQGIFEGLKVLDCASFIAAPAAATVLADFGAEVIKIEPPGMGDPYRHIGQLRGNPSSEHNYAWLLVARNKRSLALDLASAAGREILHRLVADADVFITNYPPEVRRRIGVTYEELAPLNDRLIYASFTGYGEEGEEANKPGFDSTAWWARSGLISVVKSDSQALPARSVAGMGDHPSAMAFFGAIVTGLYQRERTGKGARVGSSLMANGVWSNGFLVQAKLCGATFMERAPRDQAPNALVNHYHCRDGHWLMLSLLREDQEWPVLADGIGRVDLTTDPRFATKAARHANARALIRILDEVFAGSDFSEWRRMLDAKGLIFGFAATLDDVVTDRQMRANDVLVPLEDTDMLTVNSPLWVEGAPKVPPHLAPEIGQHSAEVLRELGYDDDQIHRLRQSGVINK